MPHSTHFLLLLFILLSLLPPKSSFLTVEKTALLQFKSHLNDPSHKLTSWRNSTSPCEFSGVTCDPSTERVTEIFLTNLPLSGQIPPSLPLLKHLTSFVITSTAISGPIPSEFTAFGNLRVLNLSLNRLTGSIPNLSGLKSLEVLDLSGNSLSGDFPSWVWRISGLVKLELAQNHFNKAEIPRKIENLKNLTLLSLTQCNLVGEIPDSIFNLKNLDTLALGKNNLSGRLSPMISKLIRLKSLVLFSNNLTGEIPKTVGSLSSLEEIDISSNHFHGDLPAELGNLKNLTVFECYENHFTGSIPQGFGDLQHLIGFSLYRNSFSGFFPGNFGKLSPLISFDISENEFSGPFPAHLCDTRHLQLLLALDNNFSGHLPSSYADCKSLIRFRVNQNQLSGYLPSEIWALPNAIMFDVSDNDFQGEISPYVGNSTKLAELILANNRFSGPIPSQIEHLMHLERIWLSNNSFSGEIPSQIGALKQISSLRLDSNSFSGSIPVEIDQCSRLVDLNLAGNSLTGSIPAELDQMSSLNSLNLSSNQLTGTIPTSLEKLELSLIDLSYNQLSGSVPSDLLGVGGETAFQGNKDLCVEEEPRAQINHKLPQCESETNSSSNKLTLISMVLIAMIAVFLSLLMFMKIRVYRIDARRRADDEEGKIKYFQPLDLDENEIRCLKEENVIGRGGTGKVYRLDLKNNGGSLAVKQQYLKMNRLKSLSSEMEIMGRIRHRNILKIYAWFVREGTGFLVLEFMAKGTLFHALHPDDQKPVLDWHQRYNIALGVARALAYLHHDCSPPIVHRDVKSTNILLDADYEPKIADFGVARAAKSSPKVSEFSGLAGTHGYMAPEMAYSLKITEESDVYSYGVVLLELVTGRRPVEEEFGEGISIVSWVLRELRTRKAWGDLLDDRAVVSEEVKDDMIKVMKLGTLCTMNQPSHRPSMREVVKMLV